MDHFSNIANRTVRKFCDQLNFFFSGSSVFKKMYLLLCCPTYIYLKVIFLKKHQFLRKFRLQHINLTIISQQYSGSILRIEDKKMVKNLEKSFKDSQRMQVKDVFPRTCATPPQAHEWFSYGPLCLCAAQEDEEGRLAPRTALCKVLEEPHSHKPFKYT